MEQLLAMPYLLRIITDYSHPPWECVNTLNELRSIHLDWILDSLDPYEGLDFAGWWIELMKAKHPDEWPSWMDGDAFDEDYKEQWFDQHEDGDNTPPWEYN